MTAEGQRQKLSRLYVRTAAPHIQITEASLLHDTVGLWCARFGIGDRSPERDRLERLARMVWAWLIEHADSDGDGVIGGPEFVGAYGKPGFIENIAVPVTLASTGMADPSDDRRLSMHDWVRLYAAGNQGHVFDAICIFRAGASRSGDIEVLTRDGVIQGVSEFYEG
ncbi:hypothetical protein ABT299_43080 [Spirillospora sp. NPDC000708]